MIAAAVPAALVIVKNAGHGFKPTGGPISPTRSEITNMMADFFDKYLKGNVATTAQTSSTIISTSETPTRLWLLAVILIAIGVTALAIFARRSTGSSSSILHTDLFFPDQ